MLTYLIKVLPNCPKCRQNRKGKQSDRVLYQAIVVGMAADHFGSWFNFRCLGFRLYLRADAVGLAVLP